MGTVGEVCPDNYPLKKKWSSIKYSIDKQYHMWYYLAENILMKGADYNV